MKRLNKLRILVPVFLSVVPLVLLADPAPAQEGDACPIIVQTAIEATDAGCQATGRNQACYGYAQVSATPQEGVVDFTFVQAGDIENVADIQTIQASPLDEAAGNWGVALLRIQADLPDALPGQNVTFVLFGDVEIENAGSEQPALPTLDVTAVSSANLRGGPSTGHAIVGSLNTGETVTADGRLADNSWLRLRLPEGGGHAWIFGSLVTPNGDVNALAAVEPDAAAPAYGPMQAFYFRTGLSDAPCAAAPPSGILIQTPQGAGEVTLNMNGVELVLGSTALLQGGSDAPGMNIAMLDGMARFPGHEDLTVYAGQYQQWVMQDGLWMPGGGPLPLDASLYAGLPLNLLPDRVDIFQRQTLVSGPYAVVTRDYLPFPDMPADHWAAILVHGRGLDYSSWGWLTPWLLDQGWGVLVPDMPGYGQTGGDDPHYADWPGVIQDVAGYAQGRGYQQGVIIGSSIGANSGLAACADLPDWCQGAFLFSPGLNYFGVETPGPMQQMGDRPVFIITSENDTRGGSGDVARQVAAYGRHVTVQIYPGDLHGTDLSSAYDLTGWLADYATPDNFLYPEER